MKKILFTLLVSLNLVSTHNVFADGALAIDSNQGDQYGFSYDHSSSDEANNRALEECGSGCSVVETFSGGCAAYAADQENGSTAYGWGAAPSSNEAKDLALQYCSSNGGSQCIVRSWGCDSQ